MLGGIGENSKWNGLPIPPLTGVRGESCGLDIPIPAPTGNTLLLGS